MLHPNTYAQDCPEGELSFDFNNLEVVTAFAIFADFAGLNAKIDQSISYLSPLSFDCTPWEIAARNLADKYSLEIKIKNGTMYVTKY